MEHLNMVLSRTNHHHYFHTKFAPRFTAASCTSSSSSFVVLDLLVRKILPLEVAHYLHVMATALTQIAMNVSDVDDADDDNGNDNEDDYP